MRDERILQLFESLGSLRPEPYLCNPSNPSLPSHSPVFNCFITSVKTLSEKVEKTLSSLKNYDTLPN